jgi:RNA polymerase sigma-70 factor (ECF subfamily)
MDRSQPHPVDVPLDDEFAALRGRVARAVRRTCPTWLGSQADDIVQNVMTQLLRTLRACEGDASFSAMYVEKAARGATVDEIRRIYRRHERATVPEAFAEGRASPSPGPERCALSAEIAREIAACLAHLSNARRLAVILHLQGCTVPEVACRLCWSEKRTENLVYRGLADLRAELRTLGLAAGCPGARDHGPALRSPPSEGTRRWTPTRGGCSARSRLHVVGSPPDSPPSGRS